MKTDNICCWSKGLAEEIHDLQIDHQPITNKVSGENLRSLFEMIHIAHKENSHFIEKLNLTVPEECVPHIICKLLHEE